MKEDTDKTWMEVHGGFAKDMTLRDYYAGLAMQADLTGYDGSYWARVAKHAYEMADAMLEARNAK
jgi:hypothetical protein